MLTRLFCRPVDGRPGSFTITIRPIMSSVTRRRVPASSFTRRHVIHHTPSCTIIIIHTPPCHPSHAVVYHHHHSHAAVSSTTRRRVPSSSFTRRRVIHHTPSCTSIGDNNGCRPCTGNFHQMLTRLFCRPVDGRPGSITITARCRVPALEPQLCHVRHYIAITITTRRSVHTPRHVIHHTPSCTIIIIHTPSCHPSHAVVYQHQSRHSVMSSFSITQQAVKMLTVSEDMSNPNLFSASTSVLNLIVLLTTIKCTHSENMVEVRQVCLMLCSVHVIKFHPPNVIKFHKVRRKGLYVTSSCVAYGVQAYQSDCVVAYIRP